MWARLVVTLCAVYPALTLLLFQDSGSIHVHKRASGPLLEEYTPLDNNDIDASEVAKTIVKNFMASGNNNIDFKKHLHDISLNEISARSSLILYDASFKGLQHATLNNLEIRMQNGRIDFSVSIPALFFMCAATVNGTIDDTTYASAGNASLFFTDVEISGIISVKREPSPELETVFQIVDSDIKIDIDDLLISISIVEDLESFKTKLLKYFNKPKEDIIASVSTALQDIINSELVKISANDITNILLPEPVTRMGSSFLRSQHFGYPFYYK